MMNPKPKNGLRNGCGAEVSLWFVVLFWGCNGLFLLVLGLSPASMLASLLLPNNLMLKGVFILIGIVLIGISWHYGKRLDDLRSARPPQIKRGIFALLRLDQVFWVIMACMFIGFALTDEITDRQFAAVGAPDTAMLTECGQEKGRNTTTPYVIFTYTLNTTTYTNRYWATDRLVNCEDYPAGTILDIAYLPFDPATSRVTTPELVAPPYVAERGKTLKLLCGLLFLAMLGASLWSARQGR